MLLYLIIGICCLAIGGLIAYRLGYDSSIIWLAVAIPALIAYFVFLFWVLGDVPIALFGE